jgi:hypothetical protein
MNFRPPAASRSATGVEHGRRTRSRRRSRHRRGGRSGHSGRPPGAAVARSPETSRWDPWRPRKQSLVRSLRHRQHFTVCASGLGHWALLSGGRTKSRKTAFLSNLLRLLVSRHHADRDDHPTNAEHDGQGRTSTCWTSRPRLARPRLRGSLAPGVALSIKTRTHHPEDPQDRPGGPESRPRVASRLRQWTGPRETVPFEGLFDP